MAYCKHQGFTLVELIAVLVILGIVSAIGSSFIVSTVNSYEKSEKRSKLISRGRVAIEQMVRELRISLPNALRVSASGNCLEYLPVVAGASARGWVADAENNPANDRRINSITTSPFTLSAGTAAHVVIGGLSAAEIYTAAATSARASVSGLVGTSPYQQVNLQGDHRFLRQSISSRVFITDDPRRYCLNGNRLEQYIDYGLDTGSMDDTVPGGATTSLLAENVSTGGLVFSLSPASQDRNTAISIALTFAERGEQVNLYQEVLVRNVP